MGVELLITFYNDQESFYPGQTIQGEVTLINDAEIKIKGLTITFFGDIEVYWTEAEATSDSVSPHRNQNDRHRRSQSITRHIHKEFRNQETILCHEIVLLGQGDAEGGAEFILNSETKVFTFEYQIPSVGLPTTYADLPYGSIKYCAEARLKRPLFRYDKFEKEFVVKEIVDISCVPRLLQPFGIDKRIDVGWLCCPEGYLTLDLRLPKTGYIPGERINFIATITNLNRASITQISAALTQGIEFKTFDRKKVIRSDIQYIAYHSIVEPFGVTRWDESFIVPNVLPPSTISGCRIISFQYKIKVTVKTSDKVCKVVCPIFIGTESFDIRQTLTVIKPESISSRIENETASTSACSTFVMDRMDREVIKREYDPSLNPFLDPESEVEDLISLSVNEINATITNEPADEAKLVEI